MCVLETHLEQAQQSSMDDYELPVPFGKLAKIKMGYHIHQNNMSTGAAIW